MAKDDDTLMIPWMWREKMKRIEKLYQQMDEIDDQDLYLLEPEFCKELYYHIPPEKRPICVIAFFTVINWFAMSQRSGVWTFYEAASPEDMQLTIQFLKEKRDDELASIFSYGVHDYQNPKYAGNFKYPDIWIDEAEKIDQWITDHESWLYGWERKLLMDNKELICSIL